MPAALRNEKRTEKSCLLKNSLRNIEHNIMFCAPKWTDCAHCFPSMAERICTACAESCAPTTKWPANAATLLPYWKATTMRRTAYDRYDRKLLFCLPVPNGAGHPNHHPPCLAGRVAHGAGTGAEPTAAHLPACFLCRRQKPNGNCPETGSVSSYGQLPYPCSKGGSQPAAALLPNCRGQGQ